MSLIYIYIYIYERADLFTCPKRVAAQIPFACATILPGIHSKQQSRTETHAYQAEYFPWEVNLLCFCWCCCFGGVPLEGKPALFLLVFCPFWGMPLAGKPALFLWVFCSKQQSHTEMLTYQAEYFLREVNLLCICGYFCLMQWMSSDTLCVHHHCREYAKIVLGWTFSLKFLLPN